MNYQEQQQYFDQGKKARLIWLLLIAAASLVCVWLQRDSPNQVVAVFFLIIAASLASLSYTPDYLHLTANPLKISKWEKMIRWRIVATAVAIPVLQIWLAGLPRTMIWWTLAIGCWLALANFFA